MIVLINEVFVLTQQVLHGAEVSLFNCKHKCLGMPFLKGMQTENFMSNNLYLLKFIDLKEASFIILPRSLLV